MAERLDIITRIPQAIIETILCLLPIEGAARTSILSKEWRYRWTKIPKLVFCRSIVKRPSEMKQLNWWKQLSGV
ncbi:putative F-box-like domain superfamily protein [Helianthus debilis subsp. tardiflorus]